MARFIRKLCIFAVIFAAVLTLLAWMSTLPQFRLQFAAITGSAEFHAGEGEAEQYIRNVSAETDFDGLILGDSVCNQIFSGLQRVNPSCCIDGNNRGLTMAGEYLLLDEFLRHQDQVSDVWLIIGPDMLQSEIDLIYGYQYVVIPFSRYGMLDRLEPETHARMKEMYGPLFLNRQVATLIGDSSVGRKLYLNYLKDKYDVEAGSAGLTEWDGTGVEWVSETTCLYLPKISSLCEQNHIRLHLLPTPQPDDVFRHDQITAIRERVEELGLSEYFTEYFDAIRYYPPEQFPDGTHFGGDYENQDYFNAVIEEMYVETGYMDGFVTVL